MGEEILRKFGKYFLLDRIAQGGMAEIYRARTASQDGASRLLVIKKVISGYGGNVEFLEMFKSEIKVTLGFNHPNIVQVYDFGEFEGQPYIAMEFIDGRNLRQFAARFYENGEKMPVDLAAHIVKEAAAALHYAHSYKDKISGEPLNIVHRDISPQNILISYDGGVKVIDFGIAKATTNTESTKAGVIKGKLSYLSPEQISGEALDGRSDIFGLGIVLWELLVGKKLFSAPGENEYAVLKQIESCATHVKPPSTLNPAVPKELDYIVLKSLAKQRDKRYQNADEMQRALHKFIYNVSPEFNPADLSQYAKQMFSELIVEDRKRIKRLNEKVEALIKVQPTPEPEAQASPKPATPAAPVPAPSTATMRGKDIDRKELRNQPKVELDPNSVAKTGIYSLPPTTILSPSSQTRTVTQKSRQKEAPAPSRSLHEQKPEPVFSQPMDDGGFSPFKWVAVAALTFGAYFFYPHVKERIVGVSTDRAPASIKPSEEVGSVPSTRGQRIRLKLKLLPDSMTGETQLKVNGVAVSDARPEIDVTLGETIEIHAVRKGFQVVSKEFVLSESDYAGQREASVDLRFEPLDYGLLSMQTTPSADAVLTLLDAKTRKPAAQARSWELRTPFENEKLPPGLYRVQLQNKFLGMEKATTVEIREGKTTVINEKLELKR